MQTVGSHSFQSYLGAIKATIHYEDEDGFVTPVACEIAGTSASLLDDGNHFSCVQLRVWQRAAQADYARRTGADYEPDYEAIFRSPGSAAVRAIEDYFTRHDRITRVEANARWGA